MKKTVNIYYEVGQIVRILSLNLEGKVCGVFLTEKLEIVYHVCDTNGIIQIINNPLDLIELRRFTKAGLL